MHVVAVLALERVVAFDLATPCEVFGRTKLPGGRAAYEVRVCAPTKEVDAGGFRLRAPWGLGAIARAHTVILPGISDVSMPIPGPVVRAVRAAARRGRASRRLQRCVRAGGDGTVGRAPSDDALARRGRTRASLSEHRRQSRRPLRRQRQGSHLGRGGGGARSCLHLVRRDYGASVAADAARLSVMPLERAGGQAQFIDHEPPSPEGASLEPLQRWLEKNLDQPLALEDIARRASMSIRTLNRRFREQTGTTPLQWVLRARARRAQHLLETATSRSTASRRGPGSDRQRPSATDFTASSARARRATGAPSAAPGASSTNTEAKSERRDGRVELAAVGPDSSGRSLHRTARGFQHATARVFEVFAGPKHRLFADDAGPAHLLDFPLPSVMIQCRLRSWAVSDPSLLMLTV